MGNQTHCFGVFERIISVISKPILSFSHLNDFTKFAFLGTQSLQFKSHVEKKLECGGTIVTGFLQTLTFTRKGKDWLVTCEGWDGEVGMGS